MKMSFKKVTAALLAGVMMFGAISVPCYAFDRGNVQEETEDATASVVNPGNVDVLEETEASKKEDPTVKDNVQEPSGSVQDGEQLPYDMKVGEDGSCTFTFGDWEWTVGGEEEDSGTTGRVNSKVRNYLHLRNGSGMDYEIIGHLLPGEEVKVIGEDGNWYEVEIPERKGFVYKDYLDVFEAAEEKDEFSEELLSMMLYLMMTSLKQPEESPALSLTPDGNMTLVDDIGSPTGEGQQFITLVTKAGNTFYMVIDRNDKGEENVHFMNLVDEADLFALMDEDQAAALKAEREEKKQEEAVIPTAPTEPSETEPKLDDQTVKEKPKVNVLPVVCVIALLALAGGGYFLMQAKKKKPKAEKPDPDADYRDEDEEEYEFLDDDDEEIQEASGDDDTGYEESYQPGSEELQ